MGFDSQLCASFTYVGLLLHCAHKRFVDIMKVYVEWSNDSVKIATLLTFETLNWEYTFATDVLIAIRDELSLVCSGAPGAPDVSGHDNFGTRHFRTYSIRYIVTLEHAKFGT